MIAAVDRLSASLRAEIGESLKTIRGSQPLEQVTTGSLEALRKYTQAEAAVLGDRQIELLREAIRLDSTFAMAYRKLAVAINTAGGDFADQVEAATQAYLLRDRLPRIERLQTEAYYNWSVEYDVDATIEAYRAVLEIQPDDYIALNNLGIALERKGDVEAAAGYYRRSIESRPSGLASWSNHVPALVLLGRTEDARATVREYEDENGTGTLSAWLDMLIHSQLRQPDSVVAKLTPWLEDEDEATRWWVRRFRAGGLLATGRLRDADRDLEELVRQSGLRNLPDWQIRNRIDQALVRVALLGDPAAGIQIVNEALEEVAYDSITSLNRPYLDLSRIFAYAGDATKARWYLQEYERNVPAGLQRGNPERHRARGALAVAEGRYQDAVRQYELLDDQLPNSGLYELALSYRLAGNPNAAISTLEKISDINSILFDH